MTAPVHGTRPVEGVPNPKNTVNSVAKAFAVLQAFSANRQVLSVSDVAEETGLSRGTAFRLLHTIADLGYLEPVPGKRYRLSLKCLELGYVALSSCGLPNLAAPLLERQVPGLVDAASLGTLDGADVLYLQRYDSGAARHNTGVTVGHRVRAYSAALGHAILAHLPRDRQVEILDSTERIKLSERTLVTLPDLLVRLDEVHETGLAVSDGENAYGLRTVAAPVLDPAGRPVAGVSLTVDAARMEIGELVATAGPVVRDIAAQLAHALALTEGRTSTQEQTP